MEYQGGGYAILRTLRDLERQSGWQGYTTIEEICAVARGIAMCLWKMITGVAMATGMGRSQTRAAASTT